MPAHPVEEERIEDAIGVLLRGAVEAPDAPLLATRSRAYSYADVARCAAGIARLLHASGLSRGQRVALLLDEYDHFFLSLFGVWLAGGVAVPLNTTLPQKQLERLIAKAAPIFTIVPELDVSPGERAATLVLPCDREGFILGSGDPAEYVTERVQPHEMAMVMFTSGTTGVPKGVCQTLHAISANASQVALRLDVRATDKIFINTPPYFTSAICHFLTLLAAGGCFVGYRGFFFGERLLDELILRGCTGFGGAPTHLVRVVTPMSEPRAIGLRFWISSGDHLPVPVLEKATQFLPGVRIFNMYGLTEVAGRLCILSPEEAGAALGSVGRPIAGMQVIARDANGHPLSPDADGELYVTGPLLMQRYLDEPELTRRTITAGGLRTGDFGRVDERGYVWVAGREDDIIKSGGEKISTMDVERALMQLGVFADAAVIAEADPVLGHVPVAFVVPNRTEKITPSAILQRLKPMLAGSALPRRIVILDELPRSGSGKIIRTRLRTRGGIGP